MGFGDGSDGKHDGDGGGGSGDGSDGDIDSDCGRASCGQSTGRNRRPGFSPAHP